MRKFAAGIIAFVCLFGFACTGEKRGNEGTVNLAAYHQMDLANPQVQYWPITLDAFARAHPGIKIEWEYVSGEQFHDKFQAMAAANDIPDVFTTYPGARSGYILNRGMVKDIRPLLTEDFKAGFNPAIWEGQGPNGEIYIISPNLAVATVVYVNTRLQNELGLPMPSSFEELVAQVPEIRQAGLTPLMFANRGVWQAQSLLLSMLVDRMAGKEWFDRARAGTASFTDQGFVSSLEIIRRMVETQLFPAGVNQLEGPESWAAFVRNEAVYLLDAGWRIPALLSAASPEDFSTYRVTAFPAIPGEVTRNSSAATLGEAIAMNARLNGEKMNAAWSLMTFLYGREGSDILLRHGVLTTYLFDLSQYDIDHLTMQYSELINGQTMGYIIDAVMDSEGVNNILNPGIQAVMIGDKTPAQLAAEYEAWVAANDSNRRK